MKYYLAQVMNIIHSSIKNYPTRKISKKGNNDTNFEINPIISIRSHINYASRQETTQID